VIDDCQNRCLFGQFRRTHPGEVEVELAGSVVSAVAGSSATGTARPRGPAQQIDVLRCAMVTARLHVGSAGSLG